MTAHIYINKWVRLGFFLLVCPTLLCASISFLASIRTSAACSPAFPTSPLIGESLYAFAFFNVIRSQAAESALYLSASSYHVHVLENQWLFAFYCQRIIQRRRHLTAYLRFARQEARLGLRPHARRREYKQGKICSRAGSHVANMLIVKWQRTYIFISAADLNFLF